MYFSKYFLSCILMWTLFDDATSCFYSKKVGSWTAWVDASPCSVSCGGGSMRRTRNCVKPVRQSDATCPGEPQEEVSCMTNPCYRITSKYSKVLVAIGETSDGPTNDVEIIDLLSSITTCPKPPNFPHENAFATGALGFQDKPLICGGRPMLSKCYVYEETSWKKSPYSFTHGRFYSSMTKFQDKMMMTGGLVSGSCEVLTGTGWKDLPHLSVHVYHHCMITLNSTTVMVIGGMSNGNCIGKSFLFSSETNIWTRGPTLNIGRCQHSCATIRKNNQTQERSLIVVGGQAGTFLKSVEVLDLGEESWRIGPRLPFAIFHAALVEEPYYGGVVLIGGHGRSRYSDTLYRLPNAGPDATWELMPQKLRTGRNGHTAILVTDEVGVCQ